MREQKQEQNTIFIHFSHCQAANELMTAYVAFINGGHARASSVYCVRLANIHVCAIMITNYQVLQTTENDFTPPYEIKKENPLYLGLEMKMCPKFFPPFDTSFVLYFSGSASTNSEYTALCRVCRSEIKTFDFENAVSEALHHLTNPSHQEKHYNTYFQNINIERKSGNISIFSLGCPNVTTPEKYRLVSSHYGTRTLAKYIAALYHIPPTHYMLPKPAEEISLTMIAPPIPAYNVNPQHHHHPSQANILPNPSSQHKALPAAQNATAVNAKACHTAQLIPLALQECEIDLSFLQNPQAVATSIRRGEAAEQRAAKKHRANDTAFDHHDLLDFNTMLQQDYR